MGKRLIDIDESALGAARIQFGHRHHEGHRQRSLYRVAGTREEAVADALDVLAGTTADRSDAWR